MNRACPELRVSQDIAEEADIGFDAADMAFRPAPDASGRSRPPDSMPKQRASPGADHTPSAPSNLYRSPYPGGSPALRHCYKSVISPGAGKELILRIFGAEPALDGRARPRNVVLPERQRLPRGNPQLQLHQIETSHQFGDGMLHLKPCIHLEEVVSPRR